MARHLTIYERVNYKEYYKGAAYGTSFWLMVATCKYGGTCLQKKKSTEVYWNLTWALIDAFTPSLVGLKDTIYLQDEVTVAGFEVPKSPDSSYNNVYPGNEDEARDPPMVPSHLQHTLLNYPANRDTAGTVPLPQNVILNHLYIENRESPRSVVALGFTHRFHSKYVTVVLYKPVQRRGNTSI
ncbi:SNF1-related protein kinase regulatory subunit beta-3 [Glycine soja]